MASQKIVLLHSRQPLGSGSRGTILDMSETKPIMLTDAKGILFRDVEDDPSIEVVVKAKSAWLDFLASYDEDLDVLTNDEFCIEDCRRIRKALGKGDCFPEQISHYRDKSVMQKVLRSQGLPTPKSVLIPEGELHQDVISQAALGIGATRFILKPVDEANLSGIVMLDNQTATIEESLISQLSQTDYLLEEFIDGPQYHVDCLVDDGDVTSLLIGHYITPLLDLASGRPSGSVSIERSDKRWDELNKLAIDSIQSLGSDGRFIAHVELLSDNNGYRICEVACRAPGGDVPWQSLVYCGVDLEVANLSLQMGCPAPIQVEGTASAWVWIPGGYTQPEINKSLGVFTKRFFGTSWISQARTSAVLHSRASTVIKNRFSADTATPIANPVKIKRKLELAPDDFRYKQPAPILPVLKYPWSIREVCPNSPEVEIVYKWMLQDHVKSVMHKNWSLPVWQEEIQEHWNDNFIRPYIVSYGGVDGGFIELYRVERDVVGQVVDKVKPLSIGVHGAIGELAGLNAGYAQSFWIELIAGIFRAEESCSQIYTDPTAGNPILKNLLDRICDVTGGQFLGELALPHKQANVYCFDREPYHQAMSR